MHTYIIVAPDFQANSAGIVALYRLCDRLNLRPGIRAFVTRSTYAPFRLLCPLLPWHEAAALAAGDNCTAVYPEIFGGNMLNAKSVARWVLNRPGLLGGDSRYDPSELIFYFSDVYRPYIQEPVAGKLHLPTLDSNLFHCADWSPSGRNRSCFYVGKSRWKDGLITRDGLTEIRRDWPGRRELPNLLRESRVLYSFDNSTLLIYEAVLCGCQAVVIPDGTHTREDYQRLELGLAGIYWGVEEYAAAQAHSEYWPGPQPLRDRLAQAHIDFQTQLTQFIEITAAANPARIL